MNEKFAARLLGGSLAELRGMLLDAAECVRTADDKSAEADYRREYLMVDAMGRYRFPSEWDEPEEPAQWPAEHSQFGVGA